MEDGGGMTPPHDENDDQFSRPRGRQGQETASYRELRDMEGRLLDRISGVERELSRQIGEIERDQDRKLSELGGDTRKRLDALGGTVHDMQASTRWLRHLSQVILTVLGTAVGGGLIYLLKLPGSQSGGGAGPP